jgi:hypothetical protein
MYCFGAGFMSKNEIKDRVQQPQKMSIKDRVKKQHTILFSRVGHPAHAVGFKKFPTLGVLYL